MTDDNKRLLSYRPKKSEHDRYERNGWIGLAITLIACAVVAMAFLWLHG